MMSSQCRPSLFEDLSDKAVGLIEIARTQPYARNFSVTEYKKELTPQFLNSLLERSKYGVNFSMVLGIDFNRAKEKSKSKLGKPLAFDVETNLRADAEMVLSKHILVFDLDLKDCIGNFPELLNPNNADKLCQIPKELQSHERAARIKDVFQGLTGDERRDIAERIYVQYFHGFEKLGLPLWLASYSGNGIHFYLYSSQAIDCQDQALYRFKYLYLLEYLSVRVFDGKISLDPAFASPAQPIRVPLTLNWKKGNSPSSTGSVALVPGVFTHDPNADASTELNRILRMATEAYQKKSEGLKPKLVVEDHRKALKQALSFQKILDYFSYKKFDTFRAQLDGETQISSPWSPDRNPSCYFNEEGKVYNCYSTQKSGDIFSFLAEMAGIDCAKDFGKVLQLAEKVTGISKSVAKKEEEQPIRGKNRNRGPSLDEYFEFFESHLKGARRCLLSNQLMVFHEGMWQPATSRLPALSAHAVQSGYFNRNHIADHLFVYSETKEAQLLVDIPRWDGVDRIGVIAKCLKVSNCTQTNAEEVLKEWGSKVFERMKNPLAQNFVLILKGPQGIGKDFLIVAMTSGLGPLVANLTVNPKEADNLSMLAGHLVLNISEFDRTSRTEMGTLKDWITRHEATFRRPYDRSERKYSIRTSFISSVNVDDILRDHTGNRRFVILEVEDIERAYPTDESPQILAQFQTLSQERYRMSFETQATINAYMQDQTPDNPDDAILAEYDARIEKYEEGQAKSEFTYGEICEGISATARNHGYRSPKQLLTLLKRTKRAVRTKHGVVYTRPPV